MTPSPTVPITPAAPGGAAAGGTGGAPAGGILGGTVGGSSGLDAGAQSPGASRDAGLAGDAAQFPDAAIDAGVPDAAIDAGVPDAGDAGEVNDAGDAGCIHPLPPDASVCPGYGCRSTREELRAAMSPQGACSSEQAVALACDGRVTKAALQCTQESVFALNIERAVTTCLKRDQAIAQLSNGCLACFVDEALCTLTRCFAACTLTEGNDCRACRQMHCSAPLARCSGLPAPSF